jgi:hypothetical protein
MANATALRIGHHFCDSVILREAIGGEMDFSLFRRILLAFLVEIAVQSGEIDGLLRLTTGGGTGGGVWFGRGMSSFTALVWIGIVMMSMTRRTSMTSINGVVFISTITSPSPPPSPTFIAIVEVPSSRLEQRY